MLTGGKPVKTVIKSKQTNYQHCCVSPLLKMSQIVDR